MKTRKRQKRQPVWLMRYLFIKKFEKFNIRSSPAFLICWGGIVLQEELQKLGKNNQNNMSSLCEFIRYEFLTVFFSYFLYLLPVQHLLFCVFCVSLAIIYDSAGCYNMKIELILQIYFIFSCFTLRTVSILWLCVVASFAKTGSI